MDLGDFLSQAYAFANRPQTIGQFSLNNFTNAWNSYPAQLQNAMGGIFATNLLNSNNINQLRNAQAQTAQGFYNAAGTTNSAQATANALIEKAKQDAMAQQAVAQQNAQAQIAAAQAQAEAAREVARLQAESALEQERLRQASVAGKTAALGPLLSAVLGVFGRGNVAGSGGTPGGGGVQTDYGAGVNLGGSGAQPTNTQQFRTPQFQVPPFGSGQTPTMLPRQRRLSVAA